MDRPICKPGKLRQIYDTIRISKTLSYHETPPFLAASASRSILLKVVLLGSKKSEAQTVI